jgi:quercetin dioxygenase-like cupin family protein
MIAAAALLAAPTVNAGDKDKSDTNSTAKMSSDTSAKPLAMNKDELQWGPAPAMVPKGAQAAIIQGNPSEKGKMFTLRLKSPKDEYRIMPHSHPTDETVTVLSGTLYAGMGDHFDAGLAKEYKEGGVIVMPKGMNHFVYTKGETVVQIHALGPFEFKYVNPKDDPRNQGVGGAGEQGTEQQQQSPDQSSDSGMK